MAGFPFDLPYSSRPFTHAQHIAHLASLGLSDPHQQLAEILEAVSYHRFSMFLAPLYRANGDSLQGITVPYVWDLYAFDRRLRGLLFEGVSRLEIAFRAKVAYVHAQAMGTSFCYTDFCFFSDASVGAQQAYQRMFSNITTAIERARTRRPEIGVFETQHPRSFLPVEMMMEVADFGILQNYYRILPKRLQIEIANHYGVTDYLFTTWLTLLNRLRNRCAHHEPILFSISATHKIKAYCSARKNPLLANLEEAIKDEDDVPGVSLYFTASIIAHLLTIIRPQSAWIQRLRAFILDEAHMAGRRLLPGFRDTAWTSCALWTPPALR